LLKFLRVYLASRPRSSPKACATHLSIAFILQVGVSNLVFSLLSVVLIERLGRSKVHDLTLIDFDSRFLLLVGTYGMAASLAVLVISTSLRFASLQPLTAVAMFVFVAFFAISVGPISWLVGGGGAAT
jgi:MFS transporter, SP family, galactose:H+ symporter